MSSVLLAGAVTIAAAQDTPSTANNWNTFDPAYSSVTTWNVAWDAGTYDQHHVLIGTVADFKPYRMLLQPADPSGHATTVDLKNGTVIRPDGTQLAPGMRVAVLGYWSKGTFIANRVILRNS
ncbi:MAG: hypothetical protein WAJ85_11375 [Candidatus Baltobacteraceae bacterium]